MFFHIYARRHLTMIIKVHPIAAIEIEISPWCYEEETKKGVVYLTR